MKKAILFLCFLSVLQALYAGHHTATSLEENPFHAGVRLAVLEDLGNWDILSDFTFQYRGDDPFFTSFRAGGYYRIHRNLKGGLFYTLQTGALHDEDWIRISSDEWHWEDSSDRFEHLLTADLTPRVLLPFLPGGNWTFSLKNRYTLNLSEELQTYQFLPLLSWYWLRERKPILNANGGYGIYFPLNFSDSLIHKQGPWLNVLYHLSPQLKVELAGKYLITNWSVETSDGKQTVSTGSFSVTLGLIWTPDFR